MVHRPQPNEQNREPTWELVEMLEDVMGTGVPTTSVANSTASGTIAALGGIVQCVVSPGGASIGCQITGIWTGQIEFEGTTDGTNWVPIFVSTQVASTNATAGNGIFIIASAGYVKVRCRSSVWVIGTATVSFNSSVGSTGVILTVPLPQGTNIIGGVISHTSLAPSLYDTINLTYTGSDLTGVVYKLGATTISTLTLTYTSGKLTKVEKT